MVTSKDNLPSIGLSIRHQLVTLSKRCAQPFALFDQNATGEALFMFAKPSCRGDLVVAACRDQRSFNQRRLLTKPLIDS